MLSLGDTKLIESLLSPEFYMDTFGALECKSYFINPFADDPDLFNSSAASPYKQSLTSSQEATTGSGPSMKHREFLSEKVRFKEIVHIGN